MLKNFSVLNSRISCRALVVFTFLVSLFPAAHAFASTQAVFIGGAQTDQQNFTPYITALNEAGVAVSFLEMNSNPFTSNHARDLASFQQAVEAKNLDSLLFVGYSVGAKFASRLAVDFAKSGKRVAGLVMIDPVGGQPPFQNDLIRFPDFLTNSDKETATAIPSLVFSSEFGTESGPFNVPCVTPNYGSRYFLKFFASAKVIENLKSGHIDYLAGNLSPLVRFTCKPGVLAKEELQSNVAEDLKATVTDWLENIQD